MPFKHELITVDKKQTNVSVEICVASIDGAIAAQNGGADRIELNSALALGGITPSIGLVRAVVAELDIPVISMLRPRESGFCYSDEEFDVMRRDLDALLDAGVAGIAFGVLREDASIDIERCETLIRQTADREAVFHRAFDVVPDPHAAFVDLKSLGVNRVMTSGQAAKAMDGIDTIKSLVEASDGSTEVLVAGGVRSHNVRELANNTGCKHVHAALLKQETDASMVGDISFSAQRKDGEQFYSTTNEELVREFVEATHADVTT